MNDKLGMQHYEGSYRLIGPPGTGKTTWLKAQVRAIADHDRVLRRNPRVVLCSLTRTAAREIAGADDDGKLPVEKGAIGTIHAHCFAALGRPKIAEAELSKWNERRPELAIDASAAPDMDEAAAAAEWAPRGTGDRLYAQATLLRSRLEPRERWPPNVRMFFDEWNEWKRIEGGLMDFTDLIERACEDVPEAPGSPRQLIGDEGQDFSALEYALFKKWGARARAEFIAGDPYQALYVWRGAHPELFFDPDVPASHVKVKSQSFRVPRAVHELATSWIKRLSDYRQIDYAPRDCEGEVLDLAADWSRPQAAVRAAERDLEDGKNVMFAAGCAFQLTPLIAELRRRGTPFANPWRTRRGDWNPIREGGASSRVLALLQATESDSASWTVAALWRWAEVLQSKGALRRGAKEDLKAEAELAPDDLITESDLRRFFEDAAADDLLSTVGEGGRDVQSALLDWFDARILKSKSGSLRLASAVARVKGSAALREAPKLYVGTIHSFKGAEADSVYLFPDLSPAGNKEWLAGGAGRDNVVRMFYVAATRAREKLTLCAASKASPGKVTL